MNNRTAAPSSAASKTSISRVGRAKRALALLLVQALILQPAFAAWDIAQQPLFTINPVNPNAVFMLDDSWSMNEYRLPAPSFFSFPFTSDPMRPRWPVAGTDIPVQYNAATRNVAPHDEFTLRSYIHNPLGYDPGILYAPWNDNDKPKAASGTWPTRAENFPDADYGLGAATANPNRLTPRDMRFRGFIGASASAPRRFVTQAKGTVGSGATYAAGSLVSNRWAWNGQSLRWEQPITNPDGMAIYPTRPKEGPQAADLFTNPPSTCSSQPPCIAYDPVFETQCVQFASVQIGTEEQCIQYQTVPTYGPQCVLYEPQLTGYQNGACLTSEQQLTGYQNGQCLQYAQTPVYETQCSMQTIADPTSETGFRDIQVCVQVQIGTTQTCVLYEQIPVYAMVCTSYEQVPVYTDVCTQTITVQTGTQDVCVQTQTVPVFEQQCVQTQQVQTGQTCTAYDPDWVCPPQNITSDPLVPARYYVYQGVMPASDDALAESANYRMVEIDRALQAATFPVPRDPRTGALRNRANAQALLDGGVTNPSTPGWIQGQCYGTSGDGSFCTLREEMQNYANWYTYYRHRFFAAVAVTSQAASDLKGELSAIRLGYGRNNYFENGPDPWDPYGARINLPPNLDGQPHPAGMVRGVRSFSNLSGNPDRQEFFDWLFSMQWVGSTPTREAVDSAGRYFLNATDQGPWADNPGVGGGRAAAQHLSCRRSSVLSATDGEWTKIPTGAPPPQPLVELLSANPAGGSGSSTVTNALSTAGPPIDGHGPYQGETYTYFPNVEDEFSNNNGGVTGTLTDVALYWFNHDLRPDILNTVRKRPSVTNDSFWQNMSTYVIAYGLTATMNTPATRQLITDELSVNWPTIDTTPTLITGGNRVEDVFRAGMASRGNFYSATDPNSMRASIRGAFRSIAAEAYSGTSLAATSSTLTVGSTLFRAAFTTQLWTGEFKAFDAIDMATAAALGQAEPAPLWSGRFPAWDQRNIYTSTAAAGAGQRFDDFATLTAGQQAALGLPDVMDYIRGRQDGLEFSRPIIVSGQAVTRGWRDRSTILGDVVNSSPLYSVAPNRGYHLGPAAGGGSTYTAYIGSNRVNRRPAAYFGANGGMFHAFDARRDAGVGGGVELFAYVPRSVYPYLRELTNQDYVHRYFVDGPVVEGDVFLGGAWKTVVVGSTGAGPAGLFALDVTRPESFAANKVLWDITPTEEPDLGKVLGGSFIGSVKTGATTGKWVAIVPNGYQSANNRAVLLIIDMATGQTLRKIDTCKKNTGVSFGPVEQGGRCDPANQNGLSNVSVVFDGSRNVTGAYAGDYQGNLWKFDLSSTNPADWKIATEDPLDASGNTPAPMFTAVNGSGEAQAITAAPRASVHPNGGFYVVFGTGKLFEFPDQTDTRVQTIYGLWDKPGDRAPILKASLRGLGLDRGYCGCQ